MPLTVKAREVCYYEESEKRPSEEWINSLKDIKGKAKILGRISRASNGNFGDHKNLSDGVWELRLDFGPDYRVYFGVHNDKIILLLAAGTKKSQQSDIDAAKQRWTSYLAKEEQK